MSYERKTVDEFQIQGDYGQGFEVVTYEETWKEARAQARCYRANEPSTSFRIRKVRVPKVPA